MFSQRVSAVLRSGPRVAKVNTAGLRVGLRGRQQSAIPAFTLAELLVVIAIIGLLVAILVPSLSGARTQSKVVATQSLISSIGVSADSFKAESRLGGYYPPSASDDDGSATKPRKIADPFDKFPVPELEHTTGASLLVYALNGADGLGTPGFVDRDNDGKWWNDFGTTPNTPGTPPYGGHALNLSSGAGREPLVPRYGPYANNDTQTKSIQPIGKLIQDGSAVEPPPSSTWNPEFDKGDYKHLAFTDSWKRPILYYRARRAARQIVTTGSGATKKPGVYDHLDNASITGERTVSGSWVIEPIQFKVGPAGAHKLADVRKDLTDDKLDPRVFDPAATGTYDPSHAESFERFIWDPKASGRITPVNSESYLLISAGPDAVYGTQDDVTNFGK